MGFAVRLWFVTLTLVVLAGCGSSIRHRGALELKTAEGLSCRAYFAWQHEPVTDVVLSLGGTGTQSMAFIPEWLEPVLEQRRAALWTFDKPGVSGTFGKQGSTHIEDPPFRRHTQGTLLACAQLAIEQAHARFGPAVRFHLRGHSEGGLVLLYWFDRALESRSDLAQHVASLILSGVPLEPMQTIFDRQFAQWPGAALGVRECNWSAMKQRLGISCDYMRDATARPSGLAMFERLAQRSVRVPIDIFAGEQDLHTPSGFVRELESWNRAHGHLSLRVQYYQGGHQGSPEARRAMTALLLERIR